jgi:RNA polymerase sigma-70 factor (ECF subfamily)
MPTIDRPDGFPPTPVSLLARLQKADDAAAWSRFVHLYTPLIYSWAKRAGLQESDAADLVQDVFLRLVRKLPDFRYDPGRSFRGWLKTMTMRLWHDRWGRRPSPGPVGTALPEPAAPDELTNLIEREYRDRLVQLALQLMRADFQPAAWQAFWRTVVDDMPAEAVGRELGLSAGAVYAAKFRVQNRLREEMKGLIE